MLKNPGSAEGGGREGEGGRGRFFINLLRVNSGSNKVSHNGILARFKHSPLETLIDGATVKGKPDVMKPTHTHTHTKENTINTSNKYMKKEF